ncbi:hypothetical protein LCGC14_0471100 [marine sediment metagenome]|uniref:MerC mercury resistance protein n=1 Tax=marine sediment metagenome TaxID=412755 RepID=A0A0F9SCB1_9ZZZZ|nr:MerC domain-containing protein [Methylophaga sp.]HEC58882.1 MerC domain-containing protein [Methylophaga sp.]
MKDRLGIIFSSLCLVHCLATPFILALGVSGILATILTTELVHYILIVPIGLLILLTVPNAYKQSGIFSPTLSGLLGIGFLIAALVIGGEQDTILTIIGGSFLVLFHLWNMRLQHNNNADKSVVSRMLIHPKGECLLSRAEEEHPIKAFNESHQNKEVSYAKK